MKRRDFIKFMGSGVLLVPVTSWSSFIGNRVLDYQKWHSFRLTYEVDLPTYGKNARLWLPLPNSINPDYQYTQGNNWSGNAERAQFATFGKEAFPVFMAQWRGEGERKISVQCIIKTSHHNVNLSSYQASENTAVPAEIKPFLEPARMIPVTGVVKEMARSIISDKGATTLDQARAIYDWLIDHFRYDLSVRGQGTGDIQSMLENNRLSGKSVDIHALFVGLARSIGIPARIQYGIRMMESEVNENLGRQIDVSHGQHSRAEFYLKHLGWIPVNPADVCKVRQLDNLELSDPEVMRLREKFFGTWEMNWATFNYGQDIQLADSKAGKLPFFLFPHAELDGHTLDSLDADKFSYRITAAELIGTGAKF